MKFLRKLGLPLGLALAALAGHAQAADRSYEGSQRGYYGDFYDRSYGYVDDYRGRGIVRCESRDRRTAYCSIDTRGGVRLLRQISQRSCIRGRTWGVDARGIWVSDGCRGDFEIGAGRRYGYYDERYPDFYRRGGRLVRCESRGSRTVFCPLNTRYGVRLVNRLSRSACIEGRTWGVDRDGIWVSRGCRAEFLVGSGRYRDYGYGRYRDYDYDYRRFPR